MLPGLHPPQGYFPLPWDLNPNIVKATAIKRIDLFKRKCDIIRLIPRAQRGACISDAVAAPWLPGATLFTPQQFQIDVSSAFQALVGNKDPGTVLRRSRAVTHVLGPAPHVTHIACASAYAGASQLLRALALRNLSVATWQSLWQARAQLHTGPLVQIARALKFLEVSRTAPFTWK